MTTPVQTVVGTLSAKLRAVVADTSQYFIGRETMIELIAVAMIMRQHVLVHGKPGTAKSDVSREMFDRVTGATRFYLQGNEDTPNTKLVGPVMFSELLNNDREVHKLPGYLAATEFAHLDEYGRWSLSCLNEMLEILNERIFKNGDQIVQCPLRTAVATTNTRLTGTHEANADRFLVQLTVGSLTDAERAQLDELDITKPTRSVGATISLAEIDALHALIVQVKQATPKNIREKKWEIVRQLRAKGIEITDRRYLAANNMIAASAIYAGRDTAELDDLAGLEYVLVMADETRVPVREAIASIAGSYRTELATTVDEAVNIHARFMQMIKDAGDRTSWTAQQQTTMEKEGKDASGALSEAMAVIETLMETRPDDSRLLAAQKQIRGLAAEVSRIRPRAKVVI